MFKLDSQAAPRQWLFEWQPLLGCLLTASLVCLLFQWSPSKALLILFPVLALVLSAGIYLSIRNRFDEAPAWQEQQLWDELAALSRGWMMQVHWLVPSQTTTAAALPGRAELLNRHLAWLNALRLHRAGIRGRGLAEVAPFLPSTAAQYGQAESRTPEKLLADQVEALRRRHRVGSLSNRELASLLGSLQQLQALPEAVPLPAAPRQTWCWVSWRWLPAALLAALFASIFLETGAAHRLWLTVPLTGLLYWMVSVFIGAAQAGPCSLHNEHCIDYPAAICHALEAQVHQMLGKVTTASPHTSQPAARLASPALEVGQMVG